MHADCSDFSRSGPVGTRTIFLVTTVRESTVSVKTWIGWAVTAVLSSFWQLESARHPTPRALHCVATHVCLYWVSRSKVAELSCSTTYMSHGGCASLHHRHGPAQGLKLAHARHSIKISVDACKACFVQAIYSSNLVTQPKYVYCYKDATRGHGNVRLYRH